MVKVISNPRVPSLTTSLTTVHVQAWSLYLVNNEQKSDDAAAWLYDVTCGRREVELRMLTKP